MNDLDMAREIVRIAGQPESPELVTAIAAAFVQQRAAILGVFADLASVIDREAAKVEGRPVDQSKAYRLQARAIRAAVDELER